MILQSVYKIRWLSQWQAIITLCDFLESIFINFWDNQNAMEDEIGSNIFFKLCTFKYIYVLYFLADFLHVLFILSRSF